MFTGIILGRPRRLHRGEGGDLELGIDAAFLVRGRLKEATASASGVA